MNTDFLTSKDYGQRECRACGAIFTLSLPGQVCCCPEHQKKRQNALKRKNKQERKNKEKSQKQIEELASRVDELEAAFSRMQKPEKILEALEEEKRAEPLPEAPKEEKLPRRTVEYPVNRAAPAVDTSGWDFCERMQFRARRLPCGEREECEGCSRRGGKKKASPVEEGAICPECGKAFVLTKARQKYCSQACMRAAGKKNWNSKIHRPGRKNDTCLPSPPALAGAGRAHDVGAAAGSRESLPAPEALHQGGMELDIPHKLREMPRGH